MNEERKSNAWPAVIENRLEKLEMHLNPTASVLEDTAPSFWEAQVCPSSMNIQNGDDEELWQRLQALIE